MARQLSPRLSLPLGSDSSLALIVAIACVAAFALIHAGLYPYDVGDDAYIHFRMARNWMEYGAPFFNPGQQVAVSSSPLWLLLQGAVIRLPLPIAFTTSLIEALGLGLLSATAVLLLRSCGAGKAIAVAGAFLVFAIAYPAALNLMETPFAAALAIAAAFAFASGSANWGALAALAALTRLEFAVLLPLLTLAALLERRVPWRPLIVAACILAAGFGWYWITFGTLLPATIEAKRRLYDVPATFVVLLLMPGTTLVAKLMSVACFAIVLAAIASAYRTLRSLLPDRATRAALLLLLAGLAIAAAYAIEHVYPFYWYQANVFPVMTLGVAGLLAALGRRGATPAFLRQPLLLLFVPILPGFLQDAYAAAFDLRHYSEWTDGARVQVYLAAAKTLAKENPSGTLLSSEIGGLGWGYPGRVVDAAGLASPDALPYQPMPVQGAIPPAYLKKIRPDFVVSLSAFATEVEKQNALADYACKRIPPIPPALLESGGPFDPASYMLVCRRKPDSAGGSPR